MSEDKNIYITGKDAMKSYALQNMDNAENIIVPKGSAQAFYSGNRTFLGHDSNISVKSDYNRSDYEYFRGSQTVPKTKVEIIALCMEAYERVGIIRNVIDLMGDFACQGIKLVHPRKSVQSFYDAWFKTVKGKDRSERFLNLLYRSGNVVVKSSLGTINVPIENRWKAQGQKNDDLDIKNFDINGVLPRQIPLRYSFLNPLSIEIIGGELGTFIGKPILGLKIHTSLRTVISKYDRFSQFGNRSDIKKLVDTIPADILKAIRSGKKMIILDSNKVEIFYYKKDDWRVWSFPMIYSILNDLIMLEKMKLADLSALDGAISNVRLWKLGVLDGPNSILPTVTGINKLRNILANNIGGGVLDLVWGPELEFQETNSQVWRFLGSEKYQATLNAIYEGLGVPSPLRVGGGGGGSNTAAFVGLNTMIKRLQYGRDILISFWDKEVSKVHKAMGFKGKPPKVVFTNPVLADEASEKKILMDMWDRDIIDTDTLVETLGYVPEVIRARVNEEYSNRDENVPKKASPFHNPNLDHDLKKLALQTGSATPSEVGLELEENSDGQERGRDQQERVQIKLKDVGGPPKTTKNKVGTPGRPSNVPETKKRKAKPTNKPNTKANFITRLIWTNEAQEEISDMVMPSLLNSFEKKSVRQLTKKEFDMAEYIKFGILCSLEPFGDVSEEKVYNSLVNNIRPNKQIMCDVSNLKSMFIDKYGKDPKIDELRQIYASSYALYFED